MLRFSALSPNIKSESATECEVCFSLLSAYISIYSVQSWAERDTHMKKIYNNPGLGVSRPATSVMIHFFQRKNDDKYSPLNVPIFSTPHQKELMSHYAVPQITPREKNSSPETADCGGSSPSGEVRLIGLCGILWTWLHPPPRWLSNILIGAMQIPLGNIPPQLSLPFFHFFFALEVLLPTQLQMAFTLQQHASSVPRLVACSQSGGKIFYYHI